jgi:hypothetical protein
MSATEFFLDAAVRVVCSKSRSVDPLSHPWACFQGKYKGWESNMVFDRFNKMHENLWIIHRTQRMFEYLLGVGASTSNDQLSAD